MLSDYSAEKLRRIAQFAEALKPMHHRTVKQTKGCCYLVIEEHDSKAEFFHSLAASQDMSRATPAKAPLLSVCGGHEDSYALNSLELPTEPIVAEGWTNEGWRGDDNTRRFIQFVFLEKHFEMDLPRQMLFAPEAAQILRHRSGFYFMSEKPAADLNTVEVFNPLCKAYVHGDVTTAAEDIAWIFFDLWRFPIDSRLYLSSWSSKRQWDSSRPLD